MEAICGANCEVCELYKNNKCKGCSKTKGCPFGKKCFIADYISIDGKEKYEEFKKELIKEFNDLKIDGLNKIDNLYPLNGSFVNLSYELPNGKKVKFLNDNESYLGNQIKLDDKYINKYFGLVCNMNFLLVCEYDEGGINPEILVYKKR